MSLSFLRIVDKWLGGFFLFLLAMPVRIACHFFPAKTNSKSRFVFLKLKGGGSLIIAMPALLGLRRKFPEAEFILVCAREAKIYAELTGAFDQFSVIDDASLVTLGLSGLRALRSCVRANACVDLEPNSWLAALFALLTCAQQRLGLVKPEQAVRALSYTQAISYNAVAPIYIYHDRMCEMLGATPALPDECRSAMLAKLPVPMERTGTKVIALAALTSDFARERMMPAQTWGELLRKAYPDTPMHILIFGSTKNREAAAHLRDVLQKMLPTAQVTHRAGINTLAQTAADLTQCDEVWAIDSGLLHVARMLAVATRSYWGPTMPTQRLRPMPGLSEQVHYRPFLCSPCIQSATVPPCGGNNLCMISMAEENPNLHPAWIK